MTVNNSRSKDERQSSANESGEKKNRAAHKHDLIIYAIMLLLFIFLVSAVLYFIDTTNDITATTQSVVATAGSMNEKTDQKIAGLEQEVEQLREQLHALSDSFSDLNEKQPDSNEDWALAEIEYLLVIATHRLLLEHDVATALKAMEAASLRIEALGDSGLIPVREQITSDINKLRAVNTVDVTGLSIYLADLIDKVDDLPVKKPDLKMPDAGTDQPQQTMPDKNGLNLKGLFSKIWNELKSLVVIRKSGDVKSVLLLPDQEYFLYQNLRLELENARISVLRRNTQSLHTSVRLITVWLQTYFDTSDSSVANMLDSLDKMISLKLDPDLPDISSSLETLHAYMHQRDTAQHIMDEILKPAS